MVPRRIYVLLWKRILATFISLVTQVYGYDSFNGLWNDVGDNPPIAVPTSSEKSTNDFACTASGFYSKPGSCREFYQCINVSHQGLTAVLQICPARMVYDMEHNCCQPSISSFTGANCWTDNYDTGSSRNTGTSSVATRHKRFPFALLFAGLSALGSVAGAATGIAKTIMANKKTSVRSDIDFTSLENKLTGINAKMRNIDKAVIESQMENRLHHEITKNLIQKGIEESKLSFELIRDLQEQSMLENRLSAAQTQKLIRQGARANEMNFAKIQINLRKLNQLVSRDINDAKTAIQQGFASVTTEIIHSRTESLISSLLTSLKGFNERVNHLQSLPKDTKREEIERQGGFIEYLQSTSLQNTLYHIINQNFAIPENSADVTSIFILDLLVEGLEVYASMLSALVSSNVYLAGNYLEERNLDEFNVYLSRVSAETSRMHIILGDGITQGMIKDVKNILQRVGQLSFISNMNGVHELLLKKESAVAELEAAVAEFTTVNTPLGDPGQIVGKPNFPAISTDLPLGPWKVGTRVSYALQTFTNNAISKVGEWSRPYQVTGSSNPFIQLPPCEAGTKRLVYRKFYEERPELVAIMTEYGSTLIRDIGRDLINAAGNPNEDLAITEVQSLLDEGADVNVTLENNMNPFHHAAKHGNLEVIKILLNASIDIHSRSTDNERALHFAALFGNEEVVSIIINGGAFLNAQTRTLGWSPLHVAVANNHVTAARALLDNKAFINIKDNIGLTPLHLSVLGNGETMDLLLSYKTLDVGIRAAGGLTPLHYAMRGSDIYIIKRLLEHQDTDVDALTSDGLTPLHYASMNGRPELLTELISHGASINLVDNYGSTPLHYAAFYGNTDAAMMLNERDHSLKFIKNREGKTAFNLATENDREEIIKLLRNNTEYLINKIKEEIALVQANKDTSDTSSNNQVSDEAVFENTTCMQHTQDSVRELGVISEETCMNAAHITHYVGVIMSSIPLSVEYSMPQEFMQTIEMYNKGLQEAQENAKTWWSRDSIMGAIQYTFLKTKDLEATFNHKFDIIQKRLIHITKSTDKESEVATLRQEISVLERETQETQEAIKLANTPTVLNYLWKSLRTKQEHLSKKRYLLSQDPSTIRKLEEFIIFLNMVKKDTYFVKEMASDTKEKIIAFKDQLERDKRQFEMSKAKARSSLRLLQMKITSNNVLLNSIQQKDNSLQREIDNIMEDMFRVSKENADIYRRMREIRMSLLRKMSKTSTMKLFGAILVPFGIGIPLLSMASSAERQLIAEWEATLATNREITEQMESDLKIKKQQIAHHRESLANDSSISEDLRKELNTFNKLNFDLGIIVNDIPNLQPSAAVVLSGIEKIEEIFTTVTQTINELIHSGESAVTAREKEDALNFYYSRLSSLQCYWKDLGIYMVNLKLCSETISSSLNTLLRPVL